MTESHARPGPRNAITDVEGLTVGQVEDEAARTGVSVVVADRLVAAGVEVLGGGPGTRETDAVQPWNLVGGLDAVVLSGGSVYGLAAADGVCSGLGAQGRGFRLRGAEGVPTAPLVGAAILFDLANGGDKAWGETPPYAELGRRALAAASRDVRLGSAGAGYGAFAGGLKGGVGTASVVTVDGITVGALVAVNSFGSVVGPDGCSFWAAPYELGREFGGTDPAELYARPDAWPWAKAADPQGRENTTVAVVATDADLTAAECRRVAQMASAGLARAIRPVFAPFDGDVVFALATGAGSGSANAASEDGPARALRLARIGALAADTLARAVARGVFEARAWDGCPVEDWKTKNSHD